MTKAKILCLHGYGTNAVFMKKQAASFIKILQNQAELIFVDGPFQAPESFVLDQKVIDMIEGSHRTWFPNYPRQYLTDKFFQELDKIRVAFQKASDHYDGILGFSLGAVSVHFLLKLQQEKIIDWKILEGIKFSINMNGNHYKYSFFNNWDKQLDIPSLHFVSEQDFLYVKSIIHTTQFKDPIIINHSYGHKFPKLGIREMKTFKQFIRKNSQIQKHKKQKFQILYYSKL